MNQRYRSKSLKHGSRYKFLFVIFDLTPNRVSSQTFFMSALWSFQDWWPSFDRSKISCGGNSTILYGRLSKFLNATTARQQLYNSNHAKSATISYPLLYPLQIISNSHDSDPFHLHIHCKEFQFLRATDIIFPFWIHQECPIHECIEISLCIHI